jgi:hypothetical protein
MDEIFLLYWLALAAIAGDFILLFAYLPLIS